MNACKERRCRSCKVKIFIVLVPGSMSAEEIDAVANDMTDLCDNITVLLAEGCADGLPPTFDFHVDSIISGSFRPSSFDQTDERYSVENMKIRCIVTRPGVSDPLSPEEEIKVCPIHWTTDPAENEPDEA